MSKNINDYKDRFEAPVGITNIKKPKQKTQSGKKTVKRGKGK